MSGIFGIINWDGKPVEHNKIQQLSASLEKRATDNEQIWLQGKYAIGHRMLHATSESLHEKQPYIDQESGIVITADARIDNREAIADRLGASNLIRRGTLDSQLILLSYRKWGKGCVDFLRGDYAFVILDPARQRLFCARDHFGVKPFYYHSSTDSFVFASEVRALRAIDDIGNRMDDARIADYLLPELEGVDYETTCYAGIYRLKPGQHLTASERGFSTSTYWQPERVEELKLSNKGEYAEKYRCEFQKAVARRLYSVTSPGILLSGGIDSCAMTTVAKKIAADNDQALHTLSIVNNSNPNCIETNNIKMLLSGHDLVNHLIDVADADEFKQILENSIKSADDIFTIDVTLQKILYKYFHDQGGRVVLDGIDGDLVTSSGYGYLQQMLRNDDWKKALPACVIPDRT